MMDLNTNLLDLRDEKQKFEIEENVKIVAAQKMPDRHFYLLRHHIFFYLKFLLFCSLAPDGN